MLKNSSVFSACAPSAARSSCRARFDGARNREASRASRESLERRSVVDILEDRSVASVARWLEQHPSMEIVSRDRCGLYAQAAREGAPQARQVADRFHLMQNLRVAIEEQMSLGGRATG
ncbi:transposase [Sinorhizobium meliloti]|uniref:transposase n=1 Tax=Rhizobium meliloti TaxID=382 RepID=UPI003B58AF32